jgi:hypothetical protein
MTHSLQSSGHTAVIAQPFSVIRSHPQSSAVIRSHPQSRLSFLPFHSHHHKVVLQSHVCLCLCRSIVRLDTHVRIFMDPRHDIMDRLRLIAQRVANVKVV